MVFSNYRRAKTVHGMSMAPVMTAPGVLLFRKNSKHPALIWTFYINLLVHS